MRIMDGYSVVIIYYINIYIMVTTTTAIQIDVTQHILEQSLWSLIGLHKTGKLIFLPITQDDVDDVMEDTWSSEAWVHAEELLSYIKSIDG